MSLPTLTGARLERTDGPACKELTHWELRPSLDWSLLGWDGGVAPGCPEAVVLGVEMFSCLICCPICWDLALPEVPPASSS
ncbi:hypothetical protein L1987_09524 [Smallanthus sonchifolius]|uniref:Uncharacterized protein n=1 Tax=Smallanthus sonchifolius TaxID=185202 RepID=A0ACB9JN70_9ASTR|nr:hypothetical protein L1987_09524 [Smallanthus sonchifolius]